MDRALVIIDDTDQHRDLLREAGELAAGVGAELVLLTLLTETELDENIETMARIADVEGTGYSRQDALEVVSNFGTDLADEVLADLSIAVESLGKVVEEDEEASQIIATANDKQCDHIFLAGRQRRPTGKAIFGDVAQSVILNYNGPVTVVTG